MFKYTVYVLGQAYYHCQQIKKAEQELIRGLIILSMKFGKLKYTCLRYLPKKLWTEPSYKPMELKILGYSLLTSVSMVCKTELFCNHILFFMYTKCYTGSCESQMHSYESTPEQSSILWLEYHN